MMMLNLIFMASFALILWISHKYDSNTTIALNSKLDTLNGMLVVLFFLLALYQISNL